jgi:hypothetical protein
MNSRIHLGWILGVGLCSGLWVGTVKSGQEHSSTECGQDISMRDVLVLDLEPYRTQPELAQDFVEGRAGEFVLINTKPEVLITRSRPSKDPHSVIRRAQKFGVKRGCDLVLVLKTGPYFGQQRGRNPRIKDHGYAFVVMGKRIDE